MKLRLRFKVNRNKNEIANPKAVLWRKTGKCDFRTF